MRDTWVFAALSDRVMIGQIGITHGGRPRGLEHDLRAILAREFYRNSGLMPHYEVYPRMDLQLPGFDDNPPEYVEIKCAAPVLGTTKEAQGVQSSIVKDITKLLKCPDHFRRTFLYFGLYGLAPKRPNRGSPRCEEVRQEIEKIELLAMTTQSGMTPSPTVRPTAGLVTYVPNTGEQEGRMLYAYWMSWS